jgi:acetyl-CoA decarbonylase/synthase complex subunit gamma
MALSGIQIYKLLPQTNCKECGFPTCLAFAMKLAAKQVELNLCPYVTEQSKVQLAESAAPPIRLISLKSKGKEFKVGNEVVMFRHEKTFYNKPGLFIKIEADWTTTKIQEKVTEIDHYSVNYVGIELKVDGFLVESSGSSSDTFMSSIKTIRSISDLPLILSCGNKDVLSAGLKLLEGEHPLIYGASSNNWEELAVIAKQYQASLAVIGSSLDEITNLTENLKNKGIEDLVIDPLPRKLSSNLTSNVQIRRLALKKNFRPLGFPTIAFPKNPEAAVQAIVKYSGFIVLDDFHPEIIYPLLVLRQNIYTDPQKPIQVQPGLYEINNPKPDSPVLVTTNFSITYFSVANEVEGSGLPAWLLVADAEGMSVLTAWAAGKFDAERIAKSVKSSAIQEKVTRKLIVLPGHVAVLSGEVEAELPGWQVRVGPREAVDIPKFLKQLT